MCVLLSTIHRHLTFQTLKEILLIYRQTLAKNLQIRGRGVSNPRANLLIVGLNWEGCVDISLNHEMAEGKKNM